MIGNCVFHQNAAVYQGGYHAAINTDLVDSMYLE